MTVKMSNVLITGGSGFIGINLIDYFLANGIDILNIDINPPLKDTHKAYWRKCDILNGEELNSIITSINPQFVIHLAAETRVGGGNLEFYKANTIGVENILRAIKLCRSIKKVIITSTQYVNQFHGIPKHDQDYYPLGIYGESKVITEKLTRSANLQCAWCIVRPTNIWGPWHNIYPEGLWKQILKGRYIHPGKQMVSRSYGYVGNVVFQIEKLLSANTNDTNGRVFYLGDEPINLYDWVNAFSLALTGKNVRTVPRYFLKSIAILGDLLKKINLDFPLTSSRYNNMIVENPCDMKNTFGIVGLSPFDLQAGVNITVDWYLNTYLKSLKQ